MHKLAIDFLKQTEPGTAISEVAGNYMAVEPAIQKPVLKK